MTPQELTNKILAYARQLGFPLAGIAIPGPMASFPVYEEWVGKGHAEGMGYLSRPDTLEKRADSARVLPSARSVLVVGMPYYAQAIEGIQPEQTGHGKVAAYAWGADYHDVIPARLQELADWIGEWVDEPFEYRIYTDTGPILERELAMEAGLGWIGKNSCLVNPKHGSYFLLAEMFLSLELVPENPNQIQDHCGGCQRCIDACPTSCILPNRTIDARRCISYQTIENKGEIDPQVGMAAGDQFFGCDLCQQVCPWNRRFSTWSADPGLRTNPVTRSVDLVQLLATEDAEIKARFAGSPLSRAKPYGLKRNALNVLGNQMALKNDQNGYEHQTGIKDNGTNNV